MNHQSNLYSVWQGTVPVAWREGFEIAVKQELPSHQTVIPLFKLDLDCMVCWQDLKLKTHEKSDWHASYSKTGELIRLILNQYNELRQAGAYSKCVAPFNLIYFFCFVFFKQKVNGVSMFVVHTFQHWDLETWEIFLLCPGLSHNPYRSPHTPDN